MWAPYILSNLRCPRLATICFKMAVYAPRSPWDPVVDRLLSVAMANTCFGSLTRVVFELYPCRHPYQEIFCQRVNPLKTCDEIVRGWHRHRRSGVVYEILLEDDPNGNLDDRPCIGWYESDDEGVPNRLRILRVRWWYYVTAYGDTDDALHRHPATADYVLLQVLLRIIPLSGTWKAMKG